MFYIDNIENQVFKYNNFFTKSSTRYNIELNNIPFNYCDEKTYNDLNNIHQITQKIQGCYGVISEKWNNCVKINRNCYDEFINLYESYNNKIKILKGNGSINKHFNNINNDKLNEYGVIICLFLIFLNKPYMKKIKKLNKLPSKKIFNNLKNNINLVINYVNEFNEENLLKLIETLYFNYKNNYDWFQSNLYNAFLLYSEWILLKDEFIIHSENSDFIKKIKRKGSVLTKLKPDKWNPGDLFFVYKNIKTIPNFSNITELNNFVGNSFQNHNNKVISISVKKDILDSIHGSISLNTLYKLNILNKQNCNNFNALIKYYIGKIKHPLNCRLSKRLAINYIDYFREYISLDYNKPYFKTIFLTMLDLACSNEQIIGKICDLALSTTKVSCPYYKLQKNNIEYIIPTNKNKNIEIINVFINCYGKEDGYMHLKYNDLYYKLHLRCSGSTPRFFITILN